MKLLRPGGAPSVLGRVVVSAALLVIVSRAIDVREVLAQVGAMRTAWVWAALGISVAQVVTLARRWSFTAERLGVALPFRTALAEYYLGIFLNQVLPGGVTGDASRAIRHARSTASVGPAVRAVILERASAQVIMTCVALLSLLALPLTSAHVRVGALCLVLLLASAAIALLPREANPESLTGRVWSDARLALFASSAVGFQLVTGVAVVASYIAMYVIAARSVGVDTPIWSLLPLVAPVLMTMLIPVTVAGWGVREAAAAALWSVVGLTPEDGVAISVAYGLLVLASSTPGIPVLVKALLGSRSRTERPRPGGIGDSAAEALGRASRSDPE